MNIAVFALTLGLPMSRGTDRRGVNYYTYCDGYHVSFYHKRGAFTGLVSIEVCSDPSSTKHYLRMSDDEAMLAITAMLGRKTPED